MELREKKNEEKNEIGTNIGLKVCVEREVKIPKLDAKYCVGLLSKKSDGSGGDEFVKNNWKDADGGGFVGEELRERGDQTDCYGPRLKSVVLHAICCNAIVTVVECKEKQTT